MLLDIPKNSVEIQNDVNQTDANNTTNISAEAKTETDLDKNSVKVMGDQPTENNGLRYNDQSPVNPEGAGVERGVGTRWNIDSDLHSEKKGSERERDRDKARPDEAKNGDISETNDADKPKSQVSNKAKRVEANTSLLNSAHTQWSTVPKPAMCTNKLTDMMCKTPEAEEIVAMKFENLNKSAVVQETSETNMDMDAEVQLHASEIKSQAATQNLTESYSELEKWKNTTVAQIRSLRIELFEDTQLWKQNIAKTTVQEIVDSLDKTLVGVFDDVEKLKDTVRELFKMVEKQTEVMKLICDKALTDSESKQLESELRKIWPKYSLRSPTPACFRAKSPAVQGQPNQATAMDICEDRAPTNPRGNLRTQEVSMAQSPCLEATATSVSDTPNPANKRYEVITDKSHSLRRNRERETQPKPENHFSYLRKCWYDQIDLPLLEHQKRNIYSFKNALVATGYDRIVLTWQGMFYEVSEADIELGHLLKKQVTDIGVSKWVTEGVTVFRWDSSFRHVLRPHRFAMKPYNTPTIDWHVFKPYKYYIHVYQTKIERGWKDLRTLSSRSIAQHLRLQWNSHYWPRITDIKMLESMGPSRGRNNGPVYQNAAYRQEPIQSQSALSSIRSSSSRWWRRKRRRSQLETETSSLSRGWPWRSEGLDRQKLKTRQNLKTSKRHKNRRRMPRADDRRPRDRDLKRNQIGNRSRPNDIMEVLYAIQQMSKDVNILKKQLEHK